jgi:hypothetical protein
VEGRLLREQLSGKYEYKTKTADYVKSVTEAKYKRGGHHLDYHEWVQKLLQEAAQGIAKDVARKRVRKTLQELRKFILENPDILTYGTDIFENSPKLKNWKIVFDYYLIYPTLLGGWPTWRLLLRWRV